MKRPVKGDVDSRTSVRTVRSENFSEEDTPRRPESVVLSTTHRSQDPKLNRFSSTNNCHSPIYGDVLRYGDGDGGGKEIISCSYFNTGVVLIPVRDGFRKSCVSSFTGDGPRVSMCHNGGKLSTVLSQPLQFTES